MTTQEKKALRAQYPKKLTLDNVRCILHISKRKASWLLANDYIKCKNNGKKTRQYSIKFFVNHGHRIIRKSDVHLRLLQKFYNQQ